MSHELFSFKKKKMVMSGDKIESLSSQNHIFILSGHEKRIKNVTLTKVLMLKSEKMRHN